MGLLVDGVWHDKWYDTKSNGGRFERDKSRFRNWVTADGSAGPTGTAGFKAESGRYHLYIANACPWAHRTMVMRHLKGLEDMISVSVVSPIMLDEGWTFNQDEGSTGDTVLGKRVMHEIYTHAQSDYSGRVTVPVLFDTVQNTIVSNESADIIRMLGTAFDTIGAKPGDYYPDALKSEIDSVNERIYNTVNNGVYRSGFATTQEAYEEALYPLFASLDWLEERLSANGPYLFGTTLTEADIRLWTTLVRFDPVYFGHFKCNLKQLKDYPNLWAFTRRLYQTGNIAATVVMDHIKDHYYISHTTINPTGVVPKGLGGDLMEKVA